MIHKQSVFEHWPIESESVQAVICSPPYFALRKYSIPDVIIGGDKACKHEFGLTKEKLLNLQAGNPEFKRTWREDATQNYNNGSACIHCQAWKGQYGLEPTPFGNEHSYVEHTRLWAKEAWRVLRKDGIMFLNLSDSYNGNKKGNTCQKNKSVNSDSFEKSQDCGIPSKCQLLIPHRVAIGLVEDGWILRNTICWFKSNAMPESVTDRFSKKYEYIFMFTKSDKYYFDLDSIREPVIGKAIRSRASTFKKVREIGLSMSSNDVIDMTKGKNPGDVWIIPTQPSSEKHFAMWPERLVERMVKCSTKAGDTVLDCFAGSGTTLKVAEQLHRKGIGIDLGYHEMSKRRTSKIQKQLFV